MLRVICEELSKITDYASGQQMHTGTSWVSLALRKDLAGRGIGTLLAEVGETGAVAPEIEGRGSSEDFVENHCAYFSGVGFCGALAGRPQGVAVNWTQFSCLRRAMFTKQGKGRCSTTCEAGMTVPRKNVAS